MALSNKITIDLEVMLNHVPNGSLKVWAMQVDSFDRTKKGGYSLVGPSPLRIIAKKLKPGHPTDDSYVSFGGDIEIGKPVVIGITFKPVQSISRLGFGVPYRLAIAAFPLVRLPPKTLTMLVPWGDNQTDPDIRIQIEGNLSLDSRIERITTPRSQTNAFYEIGEQMAEDKWIPGGTDFYEPYSASTSASPSPSPPDTFTKTMADNLTRLRQYSVLPPEVDMSAYARSVNWGFDTTPDLPAKHASPRDISPITMYDKSEIRVDGKRVKLPVGYYFVYQIDDIWLIGTVKDGKKVIGFIDLLIDEDITFSKAQLDFVQQQARLLEARAQVYRIIAKAKSKDNGKA